jgi:AcrR family transcriptional regulator
VVSSSIIPDRRARLKARHREAILDAAESLIRERGKPQFSVVELAERADVSRRTVFNHFSSLNDVIMTTCARVLSVTVDEFRTATKASPAADGSLVALFDEITSAVRALDLPTVVAYLCGVLAAEGEGGSSQHALGEVFSRTTEKLTIELVERSPAIDEFEVAVLVSSLMSGISVVNERWIARTGGRLDESSRAIWNDLLERLITSIRTGYTAVG